MLASAGGTDGYVYFWSMATFEPLFLLIPHSTDNGTAETISFCPGKNLLAAGGIDWMSTGGSDGAICLWDVANRCEVATMSGGTCRLAARPDGLQLAATTLNDSFCLWDIPTQSIAKEIQEHQGMVTCLAYDRQGKLLASGGDDQRVCLWG